MIWFLTVLLSTLILSAGAVPWDIYHKTKFILTQLQELAIVHPDLVHYHNSADPDETESTVPSVTVTDFKVQGTGKQVILLVSGEHARELITSELAFWLVKVLVGDAKDLLQVQAVANIIAAVKWKGQLKEADDPIKAMLKTLIFKIIPIGNVAGRLSVEGGNFCLRNTLSGVDLNRNWPYAWQKQAGVGSLDYGGPHPLSEPESRILKSVAETAVPRAFLSVHSGEYAIYIPWDSKETVAEDLPADTNVAVSRMLDFCECMNGGAGKVAGYLALGTSMDYMYAELKVDYPLTIEIYGPNGLGKFSAGGHPRRRLKAIPSLAALVKKDSVAWKPLRAIEMPSRRRVAESKPGLEEDGGEEAAPSMEKGNLDLPSKSGVRERCFEEFNPLTEKEYHEVVATWIAAILSLADHLVASPPGHKMTSNLTLTSLSASDTANTHTPRIRTSTQKQPRSPSDLAASKGLHSQFEQEDADMTSKVPERVFDRASAFTLGSICIGAIGSGFCLFRFYRRGCHRKSPSNVSQLPSCSRALVNHSH